jgi:hypothetical protein
MLSDAKIIALYCIVDDLLKALGHHEDRRRRVSDSEVITTAFVAALYFGGHLDNAARFMQLRGYVPHQLGKSRYCRRLHGLSEIVVSVFYSCSHRLKALAGAATYRLDSFPVAVCDRMRIRGRRLLRHRSMIGYQASMHRYYCGVKVQVLTLEGIPVEFCVVPGSEHDTQALGRMPLDVAPESTIYTDSGYTDYKAEDDLFDADCVYLKSVRKARSKRPDTSSQAFIKDKMRKAIETDFSQIKAKMLAHIHAVTDKGFLLKVNLFVIAYAFDKVTN